MEPLCHFFKKAYALGMHQGITTCVNKWKRIIEIQVKVIKVPSEKFSSKLVSVPLCDCND